MPSKRGTPAKDARTAPARRPAPARPDPRAGVATRHLDRASATRDGSQGCDTIGDLISDPTNRRTHGARNREMIATSIQRVGAARSIVIDEDNVILAGNGVAAAAVAAGLTKLRVVDAAGDELIAVRRSGLRADQKRALALYDNRTGELAAWSVEQLQADLTNGENLTAFFLPAELQTLLRGADAPAAVTDAAGEAQFVIVVTCPDEAAQTALLERFLVEGLVCRAVVS